MGTFEESIADIKTALRDELLLDPYDVKRLLGNYEILKAENKRLREIVWLLINFLPEGWEMPYGYSQLVAQSKAILKEAGGE